MTLFPKILIIGNECLSAVSSNGRTLRNLLLGFPKDCLAQFCVRSVAPDFAVCNNYYYVSDRAALQAFLKRRSVRGNIGTAAGNSLSDGGSRPKRNALTMLCREMAWDSMQWAGDGFYQWVEAFSPDLILLQAGDFAFMFRLARELAEKYTVPLVIFNTEGYYMKDFDYLRSRGVAKLFFPQLHKNFRRQVEKTYAMAKKAVYCCDKLKKDYDAIFDVPSEVIYTASQIVGKDVPKKNEHLRISYLGNLGIGRHVGLLEIADTLQEIDSQYRLDIYGKTPNAEIKAQFEAHPGIRYRGFVSYEEVVKIMQESDILVHTENFSEYYREDLKYAFSTKIADSLACGTCFLLYAPEENAGTYYIKENEVAYVASDKAELKKILLLLCNSENARYEYTQKALEIAKQNHNAVSNAKKLQTILRETAKR